MRLYVQWKNFDEEKPKKAGRYLVRVTRIFSIKNGCEWNGFIGVLYYNKKTTKFNKLQNSGKIQWANSLGDELNERYLDSFKDEVQRLRQNEKMLEKQRCHPWRFH